MISISIQFPAIQKPGILLTLIKETVKSLGKALKKQLTWRPLVTPNYWEGQVGKD